MATCKPVRLCALVFPSGKRCGSPALRNQPYCYHHAGNHREFAHDRLFLERLGGLREKLDAMPASELLGFLHQKLCTLPRTMTRFPEINFALTYTLDRIAEITAMESIVSSYLQQNQEPATATRAKPHQEQNLAVTIVDSII